MFGFENQIKILSPKKQKKQNLKLIQKLQQILSKKQSTQYFPNICSLKIIFLETLLDLLAVILADNHNVFSNNMLNKKNVEEILH